MKSREANARQLTLEALGEAAARAVAPFVEDDVKLWAVKQKAKRGAYGELARWHAGRPVAVALPTVAALPVRALSGDALRLAQRGTAVALAYKSAEGLRFQLFFGHLSQRLDDLAIKALVTRARAYAAERVGPGTVKAFERGKIAELLRPIAAELAEIAGEESVEVMLNKLIAFLFEAEREMLPSAV